MGMCRDALERRQIGSGHGGGQRRMRATPAILAGVVSRDILEGNAPLPRGTSSLSRLIRSCGQEEPKGGGGTEPRRARGRGKGAFSQKNPLREYRKCRRKGDCSSGRAGEHDESSEHTQKRRCLLPLSTPQTARSAPICGISHDPFVLLALPTSCSCHPHPTSSLQRVLVKGHA